MCGIVGIASRTEFPSRVLLERLKRLEYRGYDSYGFYDSRNLKKRVGGIDVEAAGRATTRIGHRPHPLGDPRRRHRAERPSPRFVRREGRHRPQRHPREPRGDEKKP